jgi:sialate O-acetylesterase
MDGIGWYRTTFTITQAEAAAGAKLSLGMIDDDDITWINGIQVGSTNGYSQWRVYDVPASALKAGNNVLTVRVADGGGGGGPNGPADRFFVQTGSTQHSLAGTWKFKVGAVSFQPDGQRINKIPTVLYNQMLYPLQRFAIKGVIWYQGESNANNDAQAAAYRPLFAELIQSWRREWNRSPRDFPFLWVQLPNFGAVSASPPATGGWAILRESQAAALSLPNTAQAVTIDVGDAADLHPKNKEPVGKRLALAALQVAYGESVLATGPTYRSHAVRGNEVVIEFANVGAGLSLKSGNGFAVAGEDRQWQWAEARVDGNRVIVSSPRVQSPVAVRYAWANSPIAVLFSREGLPGVPFRTDTW